MDIVNNFDLQLFAEGAAAPGSAAAGTGEGGASEASAASDTAVTKTKRKAKTDPFANVVFGKQAVDPETDTADNTNAEGEAEGNTGDKSSSTEGNTEPDGQDVTKPKTYTEDEFNEAVNKEMKRRYRNNEKKMAPILRYVSEKLGIDHGDVDAMSKAADEARKQGYRDEASLTGNDEAIIERNADNAYDAFNYRERLKAERDYAINSRMAAEEKEVRAAYPDFDYEKEVRNNRVFATLISAGFPMKNSYERSRLEETVARARADALKEATDAVTASVAAGANRPSEGGVTNPSAQVFDDPGKLNKEQRGEIKRRVRRGERIIW